MRVLWLSHLVPYPPRTGALLRAYYLLSSLASRHEVDLAAFVQEPLLRTFYSDLDAGLADCRRNLEAICRSVTFFPISKMRRPLGKVRTAGESLFTRDCYMARWLDQRDAHESIAQMSARNRYDIVHFDHESLANYRPDVGTAPATLGHHNAESHMLLRRAENESNPLRRFYFRQEGKRLAAFETRISRDFVAHITCSDLDGERLGEVMPGSPFHTIPNGVDIDFFRPQGTPERPQSLIFIASMNWYPNVDAAMFLLKEIWPRVKARVPGASLDIVGSNAPQAMIDLAAGYPDVKLHGYVPDIRPMMEAAALYVCPVRDGGGTKLKVLDAFSMQKCVVAHPVSCEGIDVTPDLNVVFATTADEFADRVSRLLPESEKRQRIGSAARELVSGGYSFAAIGADFVRILENKAAS